MNEYGISHDTIDKIYKLLNYTHKLFKQKNIKYWATGGTLLGIRRHQNMIPWDDDIDISLFNTPQNIKNLDSIKSELKKNNYGLTKTFYGYKIFLLDGTPIKRNLWREHKAKFKKKNPSVKGRADISSGASKTYKKSKKILYEKYKYPFLDIFLANELDNKIVCKSNKWPKCYYNKEDLFPLKLYKYGKLKIYGAQNPDNYLNSCYGMDWKTHGVIKYNHKLEKMIKEKKFIIK